MEFSPDDDIQSVLAVMSTREAQPKADGATLSCRAEERVVEIPSLSIFFVFVEPMVGTWQRAKQAKLKERRQKIKAKIKAESSFHSLGKGKACNQDHGRG